MMAKVINKILSFFGLMRIERAKLIFTNLYLHYIVHTFQDDKFIEEYGRWWAKEFYRITTLNSDEDFILIDEKTAIQIFNQEKAGSG